MNTKHIDKNLIGANIYALYEDGEFQTTENIRDGWVMLIDIGRHRHTIMSNPSTTPDAISFCGQFWEEHEVPYDGTYLIVDDDWMVWQSVKPEEEDFESVKDGTFAGILEMTGRFFMNKSGDFVTMLN